MRCSNRASCAAILEFDAGVPRDETERLTVMPPHPPLIVPQPDHRKFHPDDMALPHRAATPEAAADPRIADWITQNTVERSVQGGTRLTRDHSDLDSRQIRATAYGMMAKLDAQIGRVLAPRAAPIDRHAGVLATPTPRASCSVCGRAGSRMPKGPPRQRPSGCQAPMRCLSTIRAQWREPARRQRHRQPPWYRPRLGRV